MNPRLSQSASSEVGGSDCDELMEWLKKNNLKNKKLIKVLIEDEELESPDDLILFADNLGNKRFTEIFVDKGIKIGKITKLLKALMEYRKNRKNNESMNNNE
eukprot:313195_1